MNNESSGCYVIDSQYNIINMNSVAKRIYPQLKVGEKCYKCLMNLDSPCGPCPVAAGRKGPTTYIDPIRHISEVVDAVDIEIEGYGACHALIFATVDNEASFAATLPTSEQELKNLALIKALTVDYVDVFSVDLSTDIITVYRLNGKAVAEHSEHRTDSYAEGIESYIEKYVAEEDRALMRAQSDPAYIRAALRQTESFTIHYRVVLNGETHYYYRKIVRIGTVEDFDHIVIGVGCEDEAVEAREKQRKLEKQLSKVEVSAATGLLTREAFLIHSKRFLRENPNVDFDFGVLRIRNLESIERQYGTIARDRFLRDVGETLKGFTRENVCMAYLGGDLFASFAETVDAADRKADVAAFCKEIERKSAIKNYVFKWSFYKRIERDTPINTLIDNVLRLLGTIRTGIADDYFEFDRTMMDEMRWGLSVEETFRRDLRNGEFRAWFQPKYSVDTREIVGAEALVRWVRPDGTMIHPAKFIPILENCGLIGELDEEIFRLVCAFQKGLREKGIGPIPISVNLSRASLFVRDVPEVYAGIAASYGVDPALVPIEITESAAIRTDMFSAFAEALVGRGFRLHVDDFGSGYSSLAGVQMIPVESIKLDKSLVDFIGRRSGESLLKHTIEFAKENGISVIAEGVETEEQLMFLRIVGCDSVQGFLFSRPVDAETFEGMLK